MTRDVWDNLLATARATHEEKLAGFCPFPDDIAPLPVTPHHIGAADLFTSDPVAASDPLAAAFQVTSPHAQWRETYKGTAIAPDFMDRFGCYCLIGSGGAFSSAKMGAYVVYMPPHLDYPWHHHPAEESYLILAGSAEFHREGMAPETLTAGQISHHTSNQPHATFTRQEPLIAYVVWKGDLTIKPIWTQEALR